MFPGNELRVRLRARLRAAPAPTPNVFVINNLTPAEVAESTEASWPSASASSQIVMIPGGFSGGDEPDGSGKFITAFFRNPAVTEAVRDLLQQPRRPDAGHLQRLPGAHQAGPGALRRHRDADGRDCPTLTFNTIGRHQIRAGAHARGVQQALAVARRVRAWATCYTVPISHGEGRFVANDELIAQLIANGQVATQYVDCSGEPTMRHRRATPTAPCCAIEGITSPDGRVLGKMGHSRAPAAPACTQNVPGDKYQARLRRRREVLHVT